MTTAIRSLVRRTTPLAARNWIRRLYGPAVDRARTEYEAGARLGADSPNLWIRRSAEIGGWLFPGEHEFLWQLATRPSAHDILEIGTWLGKSACIFAGACKEHAPGTSVVCVDTFCMTGTPDQEAYHRRLLSATGTFYGFLANARRFGFDDVIVPVATYSARALPRLNGPFRLAFIDGAHDRENCGRDCAAALPLVARGGVLAVHDSRGGAWPEVEAYVREVLAAAPDLRRIGAQGSITAFEKV